MILIAVRGVIVTHCVFTPMFNPIEAQANQRKAEEMIRQGQAARNAAIEAFQRDMSAADALVNAGMELQAQTFKQTVDHANYLAVEGRRLGDQLGEVQAQRDQYRVEVEQAKQLTG